MAGRFSRRSKIAGLVLLGLVMGAGMALAYLSFRPSPWVAERVSRAINRAWGNSCGFRVEIGTVVGSPFTRVSLTGVSFEHWSGGIRASVDTVQIDPVLLGLLRGKIALRSLILVSPDIRLLAGGRDDLQQESAFPASIGHLEIHRVIIRDARVEGGPLGRGEVVEEIDIEGFVRARGDHFAIRLDSGSGIWSRPGLRVNSLTGWLTRKGLVLRPKLTLQTPLSSVEIKGEIHLDSQQPSRLRVGLGDLFLDEIASADPRVPRWISGWLSGALYLTGSREAWEARVSLQGQIPEWPPGKVRAHVAGRRDSVAILELALEAENTRLSSNGMRVALESGCFEGNLDVRGLDLDRILRVEGAETDLNAAISFSGTGLGGSSPSVHLGVDLQPGTARGLGLGAGHIALEAGPGRIDVHEACAVGDGWEITGHGVWDRGENLQAEFVLDCASVREIGRALGQDLEGRGSVRFRAGGALDDLAGSAAMDFRDLCFEGVTVDTLLADVSFTGGNGPLGASCFFESRGIAARGMSGQKLVAHFSITGREIDEFHAVGQVDSVLLQVEGRMTDRDGVQTLTFTRAELSGTERLWKNGDDVQIVFSEDGMEIRPCRWQCTGGVIEASARIRSDGATDIAVHGTQMSLGAIANLAVPGRGLDGTAFVDVSVTGTRAAPSAQVSFGVDSLVVGGRNIDSVRGVFNLGTSRLDLDSLVVTMGGGRGEVRGSLPVQFALGGEGGSRFQIQGLGDVSLDVDGFPLAALASRTPESPDVSGLLHLDASFSGEPGGAQGVIEAMIEGARFRSFDLGQVQIRSAIRDQSLVIDRVEISSGPALAKITGALPLQGRPTFPWIAPAPSGVSLDVIVSQGRFTFLPSIKSSIFRESSGVYDLDLAVTGSLADPLLEGTMGVSGGRLLIGPLEEEVTNLEAGVVFDGHHIRVNRLGGNIGGGSLVAEILVTMDSLRVTDYRVGVNAARAEIASLLDDISAVVDVDLLVRPDTTGFGTVVPGYSGSVVVHHAEITRDLAGLGNGGGSALAPTYTSEFAIEADNNVWLRNSDAEIELEGSIRYKRDARGTRFLGDLESIRGRYFLYNNEFRITSGSIQFADVRDIRNARLEIHGETEVATEEGRERVSLDITGTLAKPYLAATSESGYSEPEIFRLLALGQRAAGPDGGAASPFSRTLARSWGKLLAKKFGSGLARSLGLDELEIEPGPGDPGDPGFVGGTRVGVGKYVSDRLYLKYEQSLAVNPLGGGTSVEAGAAVSRAEAELPDQQLLLEYRLSRSLSLDGEASMDNGKTHFNLDVKLRHRY